MAVELKDVKYDMEVNNGRENEGYEKSDENLSENRKDDNSEQPKIEQDVTTVEGQGHPKTHHGNCCTNGVSVIQNWVYTFLEGNSEILWKVFWLIMLVLFFVYFGFAMSTRFGEEPSIRLLVSTIFGVFLLVLHFTWRWTGRPFVWLGEAISDPNNKRKVKILRWVLYVVSAVAIIVVLVVKVALETPDNLVSLAGLAAFILVSYIISTNPARVKWHPVYWGLALQFFFALIILKTKWGYDAFSWTGDRVTEFLSYATSGAEFVFGEKTYFMHFFAFALMPVVTFFSAVISVLYYLGVMQAIVGVIGRFLGFCLGTTPAESLNAAGNIFIGMTEAPLMIRPFLNKMTISELHAVMTGGFATIAGSVLGAFIGFGIPANHLLSASVMSAPAALAMSKLMCPETEEPMISADDYGKMEDSEERNMIDAISKGATTSIKLIANIIVNVIAFLSLLAFVDATLTWFGEQVGVEKLTFELICSYVLYPVALAMGTHPQDCRRVARLVGVKTFTNEFIAYKRLKVLLENKRQWLNYSQIYNSTDDWRWDGLDAILVQTNETLTGGFLSMRSEVIATYALCGFANVGSIGVLLGGLSALAPKRKPEMSRIIVRAMIAGNIACFMTACIAGLFFDESRESVL
ncbi:solute carrier family 28 member 3-like [Gigantopelta aegis]|uniref:solute carrier family 28 member 3-like n=1 Tax=Gigantopelta aegis TaxID=1735272 RepID=UPI001B88CF1D|nr:solute carrier family 28 member 3-like [Gigantopelta aegis]